LSCVRLPPCALQALCDFVLSYQRPTFMSMQHQLQRASCATSLWRTGAGLCALPSKRHCGASTAHQSSADPASATSMPSFTFSGRGATPAAEAMQLDGETADARHAARGLGGTSHAGGHALHSICEWGVATASLLPPSSLDCSRARPPLVVRRRSFVPESASDMRPEGQQLAQQEQDGDIRSPLPDALLAPMTLPVMGVREALRVDPQRTQPEGNAVHFEGN